MVPGLVLVSQGRTNLTLINLILVNRRRADRALDLILIPMVLIGPLSIIYVLRVLVNGTIILRHREQMSGDIVVLHQTPRTIVQVCSIPIISPWRPPVAVIEENIIANARHIIDTGI